VDAYSTGVVMSNSLKVNLNDIKIQEVSTTCIMLTSKFSRILKAKHGVVIKLQDPQILNKVAAYAADSNVAQLKIVAEQIEAEIIEHLQKQDPQHYDLIVNDINMEQLLNNTI
jgi:hypothetical protein